MPFLLCLAPGCSLGENEGSDLYFAGYTSGNVACYWKNGSRIDLPPFGKYRSIATSIAASDSRVFVAGWFQDEWLPWSMSGQNACLWSGTDALGLAKDPAFMAAEAAAIVIVGDGALVAGRCFDAGQHVYYRSAPCVWNGSERTDLPQSTGSAFEAIRLASRDGRLCVVGASRIGGDVAYWIDGELALTASTGIQVKDALFDGDRILAAGSYTAMETGYLEAPCYAVDGSITPLARQGFEQGGVTAIAMRGATPIFSGNLFDGSGFRAFLWIGSSRIELERRGAADAWVNDVAVLGDAIVAVGYFRDGEGQFPCYWIGAKRFALSRFGAGEAQVMSIFLKE